LLPDFTVCPAPHIYAYSNGSQCCALGKENNCGEEELWPNVSRKSDCCVDSVPCPEGKCENG
jgi:hypothetical protein